MAGMTEEILAKIEEISKVADAMKSAMMQRRTDLVLELAGIHERIADSLRPDNTPPGTSLFEALTEKLTGEDRKRVETSVAVVKRKLRLNSYMAATFQRLIDNTLTSIAARDDKAAGTYCATGTVYSRTNPLLVHQKG